jgi:hypothetical protein
MVSVARVVAGDARGPDAWAHEVAFACEVEGEKWSLDGGVYRRTNWTWEHVTEWANDAPPPDKGGKWWPLRRNRAMVAGFAEYARESKAFVVALVARWATTRGTQHTMRLAREHGLPVEVLTCPDAYGPRGGR